jgi:hypothetical protein
MGVEGAYLKVTCDRCGRDDNLTLEVTVGSLYESDESALEREL